MSMTRTYRRRCDDEMRFCHHILRDMSMARTHRQRCDDEIQFYRQVQISHDLKLFGTKAVQNRKENLKYS
jgi:hypothetical protein